MHSSPTHLPISSYPPSFLAKEKKMHKNKNQKIKNISPLKLQCTMVCQHKTPFRSYSFMQTFIAMSHRSGSIPLASATLSILVPHWDYSQITCCIIEILQHWICRAGPFIHSFWKFISGVVWANSNPGSGPGGSSTRCGGISLSSLVL